MTEFTWNEKLEIVDQRNEDKVIESFPEDKLDRVKYANFLTQFLAGQGYDKATREKRNYVLNLNSEWGSGKTYFLRRWSSDIKEHYPVVYVDAWKQDYSDDPLMTVISSMISQLREQAGKDEDKAVIKASRKLIGLLKAAAPSAARALTKRYLGIDPVKVMEAAEDEELGTLKDEQGNPIDMGLAASKVVEHLINEHDAKSAAIDSLKTSVEQWVDAVIGLDQAKGNGESKRTLPAFVFIDELDRCRPSYAVEMLETIKHIFNIPGVVFVVATDTEQLQHAVKAVYGEGFDAMTYLGRFFDSRYSLKATSMKNMLPLHCDLKKLSSPYLAKRNIDVWPNTEGDERTIENLSNIFQSFDISARQAIQITDRLISIFSFLQDGSSINIVYLTFLLCLKQKNPSLYDEIIDNDFSRHEDGTKTLNYKLRASTKLSNFSLSCKIAPEKCLDSGGGVIQSSKIAALRGYPEIFYSCNLLKALISIHPHYRFGSCNKAVVNDHVIRIENHSVSHSKQKEDIDYWEEHAKATSENWISLSCAIENNVNQHSTHRYKDYVELASALDWLQIDDDDEDDGSW